MDKIRISEIAKELGKTSKEVLQKAQELGFESKTASSSVTTEQAAILYDYIVSGVNPIVESVTTNLKEGKKSTKAKKASEETKNKTPKKAKEKEKTPAPKTIDKEAKKTHKETSRIKKDSAKNNQESDLPIQEDVQKVLQEFQDTLPSSDSFQEFIAESQQIESTKIDESKAHSQIPQENLPIKRTGLRIIKKRDVREKNEEAPKAENRKESPRTLQDLLGNLEETPAYNKEKKKEKKKPSAHTSKNLGQQKIDLLDNREFYSSHDDEEEDIILFDLSVQDEHDIEEEDNERKATTERIKTQRHNPFMEQGSTRRSNRKKAPKAQKMQETISGIVKIPEEIRAYEFAEKLAEAQEKLLKFFSLLE